MSPQRHNGPNVLLAGGPRCGTTALAAYLAEFPDVDLSRTKEPHFLAFAPTAPQVRGPGDDFEVSRQLVLDADTYSSLWSPSARVRVDASVTTMHHHDRAIANIQRHCPDARMVFVLRNPVERAWSSYWYQRNRGYETLEFADALDAEAERVAGGWYHMWEYVGAGLYGRKLAPFLAAFPREQLFIADFDDLFADRSSVLVDLLGFLGIPTAADQVLAIPQRNSAGAPTGLVGRAASPILRSQMLRGLARRVLPVRFGERVRSTMFQAPQIARSDRERLSACFATDLELLANVSARSFAWMGTGG